MINMKRKSFLKSLLVLIAAPKIVKDVDFKKAETIKPSPITGVSGSSTQLFNDLNLIMPYYIKELYERYGSENYD